MKANIQLIKETLYKRSKLDIVLIDNYLGYINMQLTATNKDGSSKYPFFKYLDNQKLIDYFLKVESQNLVLDGRHITILSRGLSYDYIALKNKLLVEFPETKIDFQLVYKNDIFSFRKENGNVNYKHTMSNPFGSSDADIIGAYCIIKNSRGQFISTIDNNYIAKCRQVSKTSHVWRDWFVSMVLKTVLRKALSIHFEDTYREIIQDENKHVDLELVSEKSFKVKDLDIITTISELTDKWGELTEDQQVIFLNDFTEKRLYIGNKLKDKETLK